MQGLSLHAGSRLLARSVYFRDVRLGEIEDILLDVAGRRLFGFAVLCGDGVRRVLPLAAADVGDEAVQVSSALALMDDGFYRKRSRTLTGLRGTQVVRAGEEPSRLADILFDADGLVGRYVVEGARGEREIPADDGVAFDGEARSSAV